MALANLLSNAFQLPVRQQQQQQQQQQTPAGMGSPMEGIQHIDGITDAYFTKWSDAQNFAAEMNAIGIDVTKPDFRRQESRDAASLYRKMIADLKFKGNELKNSQKMFEKFASARLTSYGADIGYTGDESQPFDAYKITNTGLPSRQKDANIQSRLEQQIEATSSNVDKQIAVRESEGILNRNLDRDLANARTEFQEKKLRRQIAPYKEAYSTLVGIVSGEGEWKQSSETTAYGAPMLEINTWSGEKLGSYNKLTDRKNAKGEIISTTSKVEPRVIKNILQDAATGAIFINFEQETDMLEVTVDNMDDIFTQFTGSNPDYDTVDAAQFLSLTKKPKIVSQELSEDLKKMSAGVQKEAAADMKAIAEQNRIGNGYDFKLPDGTTITVEKEGTGFMNMMGHHMKIIGGEAYGLKEDTAYEASEVIDILHQLGYYNKKAATKTPAAAEPAAAEPAAAPAATTVPILGSIGTEYKTPEYQARLKAQNVALKDYEKKDELIIQIAEAQNDDVDIVNAAMNIYLELGAEQLFEDWYNAGGRQSGIDELAATNNVAAGFDPTQM